MKFTVQNPETAPEPAKVLLNDSQQKMGFIPNLFGVMANSPPLLGAYKSVAQFFDQTRFSETEKQIILLTVSYYNTCEYCMAAHSTISKSAKVDNDVIEALRNGHALTDPKLEALRQFTLAMLKTHGRPSDTDIEMYLKAGYDQNSILDVILGVGMKTLSNYTNHIAHTPVDEQFSATAWKKGS